MSSNNSEHVPKKVAAVQKSVATSLHTACPGRPHEAPLTNTQTNKLPFGPHLTNVIKNIPSAGKLLSCFLVFGRCVLQKKYFKGFNS